MPPKTKMAMAKSAAGRTAEVFIYAEEWYDALDEAHHLSDTGDAAGAFQIAHPLGFDKKVNLFCRIHFLLIAVQSAVQSNIDINIEATLNKASKLLDRYVDKKRVEKAGHDQCRTFLNGVETQLRGRFTEQVVSKDQQHGVPVPAPVDGLNEFSDEKKKKTPEDDSEPLSPAFFGLDEDLKVKDNVDGDIQSAFQLWPYFQSPVSGAKSSYKSPYKSPAKAAFEQAQQKRQGPIGAQSLANLYGRPLGDLVAGSIVGEPTLLSAGPQDTKTYKSPYKPMATASPYGPQGTRPPFHSPYRPMVSTAVAAQNSIAGVKLGAGSSSNPIVLEEDQQSVVMPSATSQNHVGRIADAPVRPELAQVAEDGLRARSGDSAEEEVLTDVGLKNTSYHPATIQVRVNHPRVHPGYNSRKPERAQVAEDGSRARSGDSTEVVLTDVGLKNTSYHPATIQVRVNHPRVHPGYNSRKQSPIILAPRAQVSRSPSPESPARFRRCGTSGLDQLPDSQDRSRINVAEYSYPTKEVYLTYAKQMRGDGFIPMPKSIWVHNQLIKHSRARKEVGVRGSRVELRRSADDMVDSAEREKQPFDKRLKPLQDRRISALAETGESGPPAKRPRGRPPGRASPKENGEIKTRCPGPKNKVPKPIRIDTDKNKQQYKFGSDKKFNS